MKKEKIDISMWIISIVLLIMISIFCGLFFETIIGNGLSITFKIMLLSIVTLIIIYFIKSISLTKIKYYIFYNKFTAFITLFFFKKIIYKRIISINALKINEFQTHIYNSIFNLYQLKYDNWLFNLGFKVYNLKDGIFQINYSIKVDKKYDYSNTINYPIYANTPTLFELEYCKKENLLIINIKDIQTGITLDKLCLGN